MQVDASRLVSLQTLSARLRLLLNLFEHEGALAGDCAWSGIGNLLLPAACVARLEVDASAADLYEAGQHCSSSADYDDRQSRMLDDYMSALARYHFVWTAYETIRFDSDAGRLMTSGSSADREVFVARVPPALLKLLNQVYAVCGSLTRESDEIQRRLRRQQPEATVIGKSGRLASGFRNYVFHGDEQPPEPDDWDGQFQRGLDGTETVSLQSYRLVSFTRLTLHLIQALLHVELGRGSVVEAIDVPFLSRPWLDAEFELPCAFVLNVSSWWPVGRSPALSPETISYMAAGCDVPNEALGLVMERTAGAY